MTRPGSRRSVTALLEAPLPEPPEVLRQGPLKEGAFHSRLHDPAVAAWLGISLAVTFSVCFVTGLYSHLLQQPDPPFVIPSRPVWLYQVSQGLHVTTGLVTVPLLLVKLWTIYPQLFQWPPLKSVLHGFERVSVLVLVVTAIFQLFTGIMNIAHWYAFPFFFTVTHYWVSWIVIGSIVVHVGAKLVEIKTGLRRSDPADVDPGAGEVPPAASPADVPAVGAVRATPPDQR